MGKLWAIIHTKLRARSSEIRTAQKIVSFSGIYKFQCVSFYCKELFFIFVNCLKLKSCI